MEIRQLLSPDCTQCAVQGTSKKRILEVISQIAAEHIPDIDQANILSSLMCREKLGSTGIGNGIAIPHGRLPGLEAPMGIFITCKPAIQFDAIDDKPVDIFFSILVPEEQCDGHLQTLATIAGKLNDKQTVKTIRAATGSQQLFEAIA